MKLLLLLLACVAATNATYYSYDYWCAHNFVVYPPTCTYHYTVYFPNTWCSCAYYDPILKVYPDTEYCINHYHCFSETPVDVLVGQVSDSLNTELSRMSEEMYSHKEEFMGQIEAIHAQYKADFENYLSQWYSYRYECDGIVYVGDYSFERDERIQEYCDQLDEIRENVRESYDEVIGAKIDALTQYHATMLENAENCLTTRLEKIAEYEVSLDEKIDQYVEKFTEYHMAIHDKNTKGYEKAWRNILCDDGYWEEWKINWVIYDYTTTQCDVIYALAADYRSTITQYKYELIKYYTCYYTCALGSSCLTFNQKCYINSCKKLGCWHAYKSDFKCKAFALAPFKYKMKFPTYKLKTCDVDEVVGSVDGVVADLRQKMETALSERETQYQNWRATWVDYHQQYKAAFEEIVRIRHEWYCTYMQKYVYTDCYGYISVVDLAALDELKTSLAEQAAEVCDNYNEQLDESLAAADESHEQSQEQFRESVDTLIEEIERMFNECKTKRDEALEKYRLKLDANVQKKREKLVTMLNKAKDKHLAQFEKMLQFYHGENAYDNWYIGWAHDCYINIFLTDRCDQYVHEFDCFWDPMILKLVEHYACGYSCKVEAKCIPTYHCGAYYQWHYCLPNPSIYCFQYGLWQQYYCA